MGERKDDNDPFISQEGAGLTGGRSCKEVPGEGVVRRERVESGRKPFRDRVSDKRSQKGERKIVTQRTVEFCPGMGWQMGAVKKVKWLLWEEREMMLI